MREPAPLFGDAIGPWRTWFAWHPIHTYDGEFFWMRKVLRRRIQKHHYLEGGADFWWQYSRLEEWEPS